MRRARSRLLGCLLVSYTASPRTRLSNPRTLAPQVCVKKLRTTHPDGCLSDGGLAFLGMPKKNASEIDQTTAYAAARVAP